MFPKVFLGTSIDFGLAVVGIPDSSPAVEEENLQLILETQVFFSQILHVLVWWIQYDTLPYDALLIKLELCDFMLCFSSVLTMEF